MLRQTFKIPTIALSTIYTNASVEALAATVIRLSKHLQVSELNEAKKRLRDREDTLDEYRSLIDEIPIPSTSMQPNSSGHTVALTGSTGALGSYILSTLLSDPSIKHIYCMNRAKNSESLQASRNAARGLLTVYSRDRVTFLTTELTDSSLGLSDEVYEQLHSEITLIIHAAWPVNFNLNLRDFRTSLMGLVSLLRFAASSPRRPHLHYISSISSVMTPSNSSLISEKILASPTKPLPNDYAESKHISELLLAHAGLRLHLSLSFSRVGQIAGAADFPGLWNPGEWFPSLVLSSAHLGALPENLGAMDRIDWVPVDRLASVLVELTLKAAAVKEDFNGYLNGDSNSEPNGHVIEARGVRVFHPVHPRPTTWDRLQPFVVSALQARTREPLAVIPVEEWVERVRKDMDLEFNDTTGTKIPLRHKELAARLKSNPAAKLLEFYEKVLGEREGKTEVVVLDVKETLEWSKRLGELEDFKEDWLAKWVEEWMEAEEKAVD
jgi:thioester reductase-like protein